jgi:DNA-directed RNA polymerase beta subunit
MPTDSVPADSLIPDPHAAVLAGPPPRGPVDPTTLRAFGDFRRTRKLIYDNVFKAVSELEPTVGKTHTLRLVNPQWVDGDHFSRKQRKHALLTGGTLARRMRATWELVDNATNAVIDRRTQVIARVPHLTSMGTFVHNGNDYTLSHQQRLLPGVFARQKDNGEIEAHVNIIPGKGLSHRYFLDPEKGTFHMLVAQATLPLMGILKSLGATDADIKAAWGDELYAINYAKANDASAVKKLKERLLPKAVLEGPRDGDGDGMVYDGTDKERPAAAGDDRSSNEKLAEVMGNMEIDPEVTKRTLGKPYARLSPEVILATTKKLLQISRGEAEVDDRDHLAYQTFLGPEDLFAERIRRDHGRLRRQLLMRAAFKGSLKDMPSGSLSPQLEQALLGSGLGQAIEEINPA